MNRIASLLGITLIAVSAASCASHKTIDASSPDTVIAAVNVGDDVTIVSRNGNRSHFVVTRMTNKALYGEGFRVTYAEMSSVEVKSKDGTLTRLGKLF